MWKKLKSKWEEMGYNLVESEFQVWYPRIMAGASPYVIKEFDDDNGGNALELDEVAIQLCDDSKVGAGGVSGNAAAKGKARVVQVEKEESRSEGSEAEGKDDGEDGEDDEGYGEDQEAEEENWRPTSRKSGDRSRRGNTTIPARRPKAQEPFDGTARIAKLEATIKRLEKELGTAHDRMAEVGTARDIYRTRFLEERKRHQGEEEKWRQMQTKETDARERNENLRAENRKLQAQLEIEKAQNKVIKKAPQEEDKECLSNLKSLRQSAQGELFSPLFQNSDLSSFFQLFLRRKNLFKRKMFSSAVILAGS